jgi:hypothetical protein
MCWKNQTLRQQLTYTGGGLYRVFENRASFRIHGMGIGVLRERERRVRDDVVGASASLPLQREASGLRSE